MKIKSTCLCPWPGSIRQAPASSKSLSLARHTRPSGSGRNQGFAEIVNVDSTLSSLLSPGLIQGQSAADVDSRGFRRGSSASSRAPFRGKHFSTFWLKIQKLVFSLVNKCIVLILDNVAFFFSKCNEIKPSSNAMFTPPHTSHTRKVSPSKIPKCDFQSFFFLIYYFFLQKIFLKQSFAFKTFSSLIENLMLEIEMSASCLDAKN